MASNPPTTTTTSTTPGEVVEGALGGVSLKRKVTLTHGVSIIVGSIIGSGIFISPGGVLAYAGSPVAAILVWAACGVFCTIGALVFAELGTMLPSTGGEYNYILTAFGPLPAFVTLWVNVVLIRPATQAVVALTFAEYCLALSFPNQHAFPPPRIAVSLLAACAICVLTIINCVSVRLTMKIQTLFTVAKLLALLTIITAGAVHVISGDAHGLYPPAHHAHALVKAEGVPLAFYFGLFAYGGWNYLNFAIEELKDPYRNLPRAITIALPLVTTVYVLANVAYFAVLSPEEILESPAVAVAFGTRVLGPLQYWVPVFVALSTFGSLNGILFTSGRLFLAGAREGHLSPSLSFIQLRTRTPVPALLVTCVLSLLMLGVDIYSLINCLSFALWLTLGGAVCALLYLRHTHPHLPRPIKVHLFLPVIVLIGCVYLVVVPVIKEPAATGLGVLMTLSGVPVYMVGVLWKNKPKTLLKALGEATILLQKILLVVEPSSEPLPPTPL